MCEARKAGEFQQTHIHIPLLVMLITNFYYLSNFSYATYIRMWYEIVLNGERWRGQTRV